MNITPMTELEAVNEMLRAIQEAPVTRLTGEGGVEVANALATLRSVSRKVQLPGYVFNTEYNYPLIPSETDGTITVPQDTIALDCTPTSNVDPVLRGSRLYDRANRSYSFDQTVYARRIVFRLPFEELSEITRVYVTTRAVREFHADEVGDSHQRSAHETEELRVFTAFANEQAEDADATFGAAKRRILRGI